MLILAQCSLRALEGLLLEELPESDFFKWKLQKNSILNSHLKYNTYFPLPGKDIFFSLSILPSSLSVFIVFSQNKIPTIWNEGFILFKWGNGGERRIERVL